MKIGLIVAIETESIFSYYGNIEKLASPAGFGAYYTKRGKNDIYIIHTGMGEIAAAAGVQYAASAFGVDMIVNFGVVGGLVPAMGRQKACVIKNVVHYKYDCSEFMDLKKGQVDGHDSVYLPTDEKLCRKALELCPELAAVTCCSGDKFVGTAEEKSQLNAEFGGSVCDMESAGIVLTAEANGLPCLLLKAVSDGLSGGAEEFYDALLSVSRSCLEITDRIMESL